MSWATLRPQIKTLLDTSSLLVEVSKSPKIKFSGYPAAHIVPAESPGDYETNKENSRTYAFAVRLFYETKQSGVEDAIAALEEVVDAVIDLFDQEDQKGGDTRVIGINLPARYTFINMFAAPSNWAELPEEQLIMAEVIIRIRLSVDVT